MMNYCAIQPNSTYGCYNEIGREYVVCPKPRRARISKSNARPSGWQMMSYQADIYDSNVRNELLDIILSKGDGLDSEQTYELKPSASPFFSGSPPSRVSNPLIQDPRFVEGHNAFITCSTHLKHPTIPRFSSTQSPSSKKNEFSSATFGSKPAVRIEGFEALGKDRRHCSVAGLAQSLSPIIPPFTLISKATQ